MKPKICPKDGIVQPENAKFCIYCGTPLNTTEDDQAPDQMVSKMGGEEIIENTGVESSSSLSSCYVCGSKEILGTCIKDKHPFCSRHGNKRFEWGYCRDCIHSTHSSTPWMVKTISWLFYLGALGLILVDIYSVLAMGGQFITLYQYLNRINQYTGIMPTINLSDNTGAATEFLLYLAWPALGAIILTIIGKQISNASVVGIAFLVVLAILTFLSKSWLLFIIFFVVLLMNYHWFIMKRMPDLSYR